MSKEKKMYNFRFDDEFIAEIDAWRDVSPCRHHH